MSNAGAIGIFDSGFGGLSILESINKLLPEYNYIYLGDNARTPYGTRSFETVYKYTLEAVEKLFSLNCELVIIACNTASAKALRNVQQIDLAKKFPNKKVLGVIRPTTEDIINYTNSNCIGILGTKGTINSNSYKIEINKFFPEIDIFQQACPMLVPLIENQEHNSLGGEYFIKKYIDKLLSQNNNIDTILLACTHYPLIINQFKKFTPKNINILAQGEIVAEKLKKYLYNHPEIDTKLGKNAILKTYTTGNTNSFNKGASAFFNKKILSEKIDL